MFSVEGLQDFNRDVITWARNMPPETVVLVQKKLALEALSRLVLKTPVDTGRARGNWQLSINTPIDRTKNGTDKGGGATISTGQQKLEGVPPFVTIFITNNLPYIWPLEFGWSKQAPFGMLNLTFEELRGVFK